ncbi:MAG: hypothetical protein J5I59_00990 [Saprospiraceae bacterium]|nr:hypothetical protein [Saprospiraceae bacterium]
MLNNIPCVFACYTINHNRPITNVYFYKVAPTELDSRLILSFYQKVVPTALRRYSVKTDFIQKTMALLLKYCSYSNEKVQTPEEGTYGRYLR